MAERNPIALWNRLLALPNESRTKTVAVAFLVSTVCAVFVSTATVLLAPMQDANRSAERAARMEAMIASMPAMADLLATSGADGLDTVVVDLTTGAFTDIDPATVAMRAGVTDPENSTPIPTDADIAGLGQRPDHVPIHILYEGETLRYIILPVSAVGYQSMIHANLALEGDLNTIAALSITDQGETPGLGARIEDPAWQALWPGREIADETGMIRITTTRAGGTTAHEVDAITGATRSSNAVANAVRFWMGPYGFGPMLDRLRAEGG